ncbi:SDR family NAD(P)-dependent oxidoreductase [Pseudoprimorskyibacter insulae]|uniref:Gluconate 5-dehydrogenase n=1 Tax=Pseudoprimorskyibacter insulae TaxID=1695997 RepID=A0A2R8AU01_9RHOB|nr:SDR family NAD(P)-dependent oxidoreductase [Pseudoprimorskyibacter insulae]SPF79515.1 Gluconate 5-dehydrogenase [Pseudoprimorskyibacter insulae]
MTLQAMFGLAGRSAFVTGGASGLGRAMAFGLSEAGAEVTLFDRSAGDLTRTMADLRSDGHHAIGVQGDVTDAPGLTQAIADCHGRAGALDIVIANAGVSERTPAPLHDLTPEDWRHVINVNLDGVFHTLQPALRLMVDQGYGKVILIGSMFGLAAPAGLFPRPAYAAAKGAIANLTRELALEYAPSNIQVNAILPGFFRTPTRPRTEDDATRMAAYTPLGRLGHADEIKGAAVFLSSPASDFMTGSLLTIDGGVLAR